MTSKPEDLLIHSSSTALAPVRLERLRQRPDGMPTDFLTSLSHRSGVGEPPVVLIVRGGHPEAFCFRTPRKNCAWLATRTTRSFQKTHEYRNP